MWLNDERGMESLTSPKKCGAERGGRGERRRRGVEGRRFVRGADKKQPGRGAPVGAEEFGAGEGADVAIVQMLG